MLRSIYQILGVYGFAYRDKKVVSVFVRFVRHFTQKLPMIIRKNFLYAADFLRR
jgi:hypothetical protein